MAAVPRLGKTFFLFINQNEYKHEYGEIRKWIWINLIDKIMSGEKQAEELGASLAAEMMFYAVASAILANEVDILEIAFVKWTNLYIFNIPSKAKLCI